MDSLDRVVAGLSCRQVLEQLGDFLDGDLPPAAVVQLRDHLAGCRTCEQFGGRVAAVVAALRGSAAEGVELPEGMRERLLARVRAAVR